MYLEFLVEAGISIAYGMPMMQSKSQENLQRILDVVVEASSRQGLTLNCKKTECMIVSKQPGVNCQLNIGNENTKQVK